jgi:type I restriction enzyme S subunit
MSVENLITEHLDIWTSAVKTKSAAGRGSSKKLELVGVKKLRELILELAVRGKLVGQDPNDEPASKLLQKIASEKVRLFNEGKIKKQKPLPPIKPVEKLFELPVGWVYCRLDDICTGITSGSTPPKDQFSESTGVPYLKVYNIRNQEVDFKYKPQFVSYEYHRKKLTRSILFPNDVVMNIVGPPLGKVAVVPDDFPEWNCNQAIVLFRPLETKLSNYIYTYLNAGLFLSSIELIGTAGQDNISVTKSRTIVFPMPPLGEQHRIVAKVDELMVLCEQLEAQTENSIQAHQLLVETLLATLSNAKDANELTDNWQRISQHFDVLFTTQDSIDQLKQTILQLAVMGKIVKQDPNDKPVSKLLECIAEEKEQLVKAGKIKKQKPYISFDGLNALKRELPVNWAWIKLGQIADLVRGGSPRPAGDPRFYNGKIPFLKVGDITRKKSKFVEGFNYTIKEAGLSKTRMISVRTVLLSNSGATLGIPAICDFPATFNDGIAAFVEKSGHVTDEYLYLYLSTLTKWFLDIASQGQGQPNLNTDIIKTTWFALPPVAEQLRIVKKVDHLLTICDLLERGLSELQTTQLHLTYALVEKNL